MGAAVGGYVLDVAALVGACQRLPYPEAVVWGTVLTDGVLVVPAAVLAESRAQLGAADLEVLEVVLGLPNTVVAALDGATADRCGDLLARLPENHHVMVSSAHAAVEGTGRGWPVASARGTILTELDPDTHVDLLP